MPCAGKSALKPTSNAVSSVDGNTCGVSGYFAGSRAGLNPPPLKPLEIDP